jgi:hypothetical protein
VCTELGATDKWWKENESIYWGMTSRVICIVCTLSYERKKMPIMLLKNRKGEGKHTATPGKWAVFSRICALISWRSKRVRPQEGQDTYSCMHQKIMTNATVFNFCTKTSMFYVEKALKVTMKIPFQDKEMQLLFLTWIANKMSPLLQQN